MPVPSGTSTAIWSPGSLLRSGWAATQPSISPVTASSLPSSSPFAFQQKCRGAGPEWVSPLASVTSKARSLENHPLDSLHFTASHHVLDMDSLLSAGNAFIAVGTSEV